MEPDPARGAPDVLGRHAVADGGLYLMGLCRGAAPGGGVA
jgi:hypothetical protein